MIKEELDNLLKNCNVSEANRNKAIEHVKEALTLIGLFDKTPAHKQEHIKDTPRRIIDVWLEHTENIDKKPQNITAFSSDNDNLVIVDNIQFSSLCSHHFFPFTGVAHVAYLPDEKIIGLSKIPRTVHHFAKQPQVQENLTDEIADHLFEIIQPQFLFVMMSAKHECCASRGARSNSGMITTARRVKDYNIIDADKLTQEVLSALRIKLLQQSIVSHTDSSNSLAYLSK